MSYLSFLRSREPLNPLEISSAADWLDRENQRFVLEQRLVVLVQNHMDDTKAGLDTSFTTHALTMAHGDFVYWRGMWNVVDQISDDEDYRASVIALAQVVCPLPSPALTPSSSYSWLTK